VPDRSFGEGLRRHRTWGTATTAVVMGISGNGSVLTPGISPVSVEASDLGAIVSPVSDGLEEAAGLEDGVDRRINWSFST
jgi:hypothetical protein